MYKNKINDDVLNLQDGLVNSKEGYFPSNCYRGRRGVIDYGQITIDFKAIAECRQEDPDNQAIKTLEEMGMFDSRVSLPDGQSSKITKSAEFKSKEMSINKIKRS